MGVRFCYSVLVHELLQDLDLWDTELGLWANTGIGLKPNDVLEKWKNCSIHFLKGMTASRIPVILVVCAEIPPEPRVLMTKLISFRDYSN